MFAKSFRIFRSMTNLTLNETVMKEKNAIWSNIWAYSQFYVFNSSSLCEGVITK